MKCLYAEFASSFHVVVISSMFDFDAIWETSVVCISNFLQNC